ncbi:MAG: hypothetical protein QGH76_01585, partial [Phycisphaerales bacterium]|nr:hypothetical protein [Phycisphaerales bacterium]
RVVMLAFSFSMLICGDPASGGTVQLDHVAGGPPTANDVDGGRLYQALGDRLLVMDSQSGQRLAAVPLCPPASSICSDLLITNGQLFAVMDTREVVLMHLLDGEGRMRDRPVIVDRWAAEEIGITPRRLATVSGWPVAMGIGGVVRLSDGTMLLAEEQDVTGVAVSLGKGLVYAAGGELLDAESGEILGLATLLAEVGVDANADAGTLVFAFDRGDSTEVGLLRPFAGVTDTVSIPGEPRNLRVVGSRILVCTDLGIAVLGIAPEEIRLLHEIPLAGARDVDVIAANYLAVCGESGRAVYRIRADKGGVGRQMLRVVAAATELRPGRFDRRVLEVPHASGSLRYDFETDPEFRLDEVPGAEPRTRAVVLGWSLALDGDGGASFEGPGGMVGSLRQLSSPATTATAIGGRFWVGTEGGIEVYEPTVDGMMVRRGRIALAGPIVQIVPLPDGTAAFVAQPGFVGRLSLP